MTLRSLVILVALCSVAARPAAAGTIGLLKPDKKADKKRLEIERHEWMAEYYLLKANDLKGAEKEYQAILTLDPANQHATLALAYGYVRDKRDKGEKQAIELLTKLTKKTPKEKAPWLALAQLQAQAGDDAALRTSVAQVLAIDPRDEAACLLLFESASRRARKGDAAARPEAVEAARKLMAALQMKSGPLYKRAERAVVEYGGQPIDLTIFDAKAAFAAAFDGGVFTSINRQLALARVGFETCTRAAPQNEECHHYLGLVYSSVAASEAYDLKHALAELALAPGRPDAWVERARILRMTAKSDEAAAALTQALVLDPRLAIAHVELGILAKLDGKAPAAVAHFVAAIEGDRYGADGARALTELSKVDPTHALVTQGMLDDRVGDVFSTDRYRALVDLIERTFGGVEPNAPERAVVEEIVRRLSEASAIRQQFKVQVVGTSMVNAFALADGRVYVTRGLIKLLGRQSGGKPLDANNDLLGHVLAHELGHVLRKHTMHTAVFQQAVKDASRPLDASVLTHVTRLHEIEADREGMVMAFLAGYHPRGGIEFMEVMGKEGEIPSHLDHPTFQERIEYLSEYWTNDVRYAFVSFKLGVAEMDRGAALEGTDMARAIAAYQAAAEHFRRYRTTLPSLKEAMNDLGVACAKLGVLAMDRGDSPLGRWQSRFSLERESAVKYVDLVRDEGPARTRGTDKTRLPSQLREAIALFKEALAADEGYGKARLNLAATYVAAGQLDNANAALGKITSTDAKVGVTAAEVDLIHGIALAEAKQYEAARAAFERAASSPVTKRAAAYDLARALELGGKLADAKRAYQQYATAYPGGPWAKAAADAGAKLTAAPTAAK